MNQPTSTTIQISTVNRDLLLQLGRLMQSEHPELWDRTPSFNAIVGYAVSATLQANGQ